jgi:hypothetical protein
MNRSGFGLFFFLADATSWVYYYFWPFIPMFFFPETLTDESKQKLHQNALNRYQTIMTIGVFIMKSEFSCFPVMTDFDVEPCRVCSPPLTMVILIVQFLDLREFYSALCSYCIHHREFR